jgi:hypothetical protein
MKILLGNNEVDKHLLHHAISSKESKGHTMLIKGPSEKEE